jgi:hypothetical protein
MAKKPVRKGDVVNKKKLLTDLQGVLKSHGITAKIGEMSFAGAGGTACTCPGGRLGVLRVVGKKLVCVCDG